MKHPIPSVALDDRLGFIGTSGSGKTYNAGTAAEIILSKGQRIVNVDPLGVWWGLRLLADGKTPSNFNIVIFGGPHGDLPLTEHAGALIGETAVSMAESCIVDLSELRGKAAERRFMTAFLDTIYQKANKAPFHLIVDEADLFAPQQPAKGAETLLGHMEDIVRRGRVKGFIPWLISQRPAVINKNVLSQVDGLLAFKLTSTQDRNALDAWIEGQADKAEGKAIKDSLPTLQIGQGVVWIPGRGILTTASFPPKVTFDSSRTPKRGEKLTSRKLKPLNIDTLKERLAIVVEEAKANDPRALRSEISALKAEKAKLAQATPAAPKKEDLEKIRARAIADAKKHFAPLRTALEAAMKFIVEINAKDFFKASGETIDQKAVETAIKDATQQISKLIERHLGSREKQFDTLRLEAQRLAARIKALVEKADEDVKITVDVTHNQPFNVSGSLGTPERAATTPKPARAPTPPSRAPSPAASGDGTLTNPQKTLLRSLAWWRAMGHDTVTRAQIAVVAGWSPASSNVRDRLSEVSKLGFVEYPGTSMVRLTEAGIAAAPEPDVSATLIDSTKGILTNPQRTLFEALLSAHHERITPVSRAELASACGWSPESSNVRDRLSELSRLELVAYPRSGMVELQPWVLG